MFKSIEASGFGLFIFIAFVAAAMFIVSPLVLNSTLQQTGDISTVNIIVVLAVISSGHAINVASSFLQTRLTRDFFVKAVAEVYERVFKVSYDKYIDEGPSALQNRVHESVSAYSDFYFNTLPNFLINSIVVIATVAIVFTINPFIALIMLVTLPFSYMGFKILNKKLSSLSVKMNEVCSEAWANENALISQVDFIKQNPMNHTLLPFIKKFRFSSQEITRKVNNTAIGWSALIDAVNKIINHIIILVLAYMMLDDPQAVGGAVFIMLILPYFTSSVRALRSVNLSVAGVRAANKFFESVTENAEKSGGKTIEKIDRIDFDIKNVAVKGKTLLNDVKFQAMKGDIIGIMGESGSGKSTLVKLLIKFRETDGIFIDGEPLSSLNNESYLKLVSYYSQNMPIVTDTIYNNLNFGREPLEKSVYGSLGFLSKFKDLDEAVLENGANLSAGDMQRIALARYFTENAHVVVLDEPTSSLDKDTENEILKSLLTAKNDKIIFLISHNDDVLKFCTQIYKVENMKFEKFD